MSWVRVVAGALVAAVLATAPGCDGLRDLRALGGTGPLSGETALDGVTQSTPLIVGTIVDAAGQPVAGARVRVFEGFRIGLDGVTQSTPLEGVTQTTPLNSTGSASLDGVTQSTPLDGVTQTTPLDGVTQSTPLDGVTQTTPLQTVVDSRSDGTFAVRIPDRAVLSVEASRDNGDRAAILNMPIDRKAARVDVGKLRVDPPGSLSGKVLGPPGLDLAGTAVFVPGTDLVSRTDNTGAYTLPGVPARIVAVAAVKPRFRPALARFLEVLPGKATRAPDLVLVPAKPRLDTIEPGNAGPGAAVSLKGADFGAPAFTPIEVRFGSLKASKLERTGNDTVMVTVPGGARNGSVVVVSDGVASNPLPFTVISSVSLTPEATRSLAGTAVPLQVSAYDSDGKAVVAPALDLAIAPEDLGTIEPGPVFRSARPGFGKLTARSGKVAASSDLGFGEWRMSTILSPADLENPDNGPGTGAAGAVRIRNPVSVRALPDGSLAFADHSTRATIVTATGVSTAKSMVRKLAEGQVSVLIGTDSPGYDGDGLPLSVSRIAEPYRLAAGPAGILLLTDNFSFRIRAAAFQSQAMAGRSLLAGVLWDIAGTGDPGPKGTGLPGGIGRAREVGLGALGPVAWDPSGAVVFVEYASDLRPTGMTRIREIGPDGIVRTIVDAAADGSIVADPVEPIQGPGDFRAEVQALVADSRGNLFMGTTTGVWMLCRHTGRYFGTQAETGRVVRIAGTGRIEEMNGEEGGALQTNLWSVGDLAIRDGSLLVLDSGHYRVREIDPSGRIRTIAGGGRGPLGTVRDSALDAAGKVISARDVSNQKLELAIGALIGFPESVTVAPDGGIYIADGTTHRILRLGR